MGMFAVYAVASLRVRVFRHFFTHWSCLDPAFEWRFPLCRSKSKHWAGLQLMIWIFPIVGWESQKYFTSGGQHALWGAYTTPIPECKTPPTQLFKGLVRL